MLILMAQSSFQSLLTVFDDYAAVSRSLGIVMEPVDFVREDFNC